MTSQRHLLPRFFSNLVRNQEEAPGKDKWFVFFVSLDFRQDLLYTFAGAEALASDVTAAVSDTYSAQTLFDFLHSVNKSIGACYKSLHNEGTPWY